MPPIVPDAAQTSRAEGLSRRPAARQPLDTRASPRATPRRCARGRRSSTAKTRSRRSINFILGLPGLTESGGRPADALEAAQARRPTCALVELGYHELLEVCVKGYLHSGERMDLPTFDTDYDAIVRGAGGDGATRRRRRRFRIRSTPRTSRRSTTAASDSAHRARVPAGSSINLRADDLITVPGLIDIGFQLTARQITGTIEDGGVLRAADAARISAGRGSPERPTSARGRRAARRARLRPRRGFLQTFARDGVVGRRRRLSNCVPRRLLPARTACIPGRTGHALIANDLIAFLNRELGTRGETVDVAEVLSDDGNTLATAVARRDGDRRVPRAAHARGDPARCRRRIRRWSTCFRRSIRTSSTCSRSRRSIRSSTRRARRCAASRRRGFRRAACRSRGSPGRSSCREGLEQTLPLNKEWSYFGDALRAVDAPHDPPFLPAFPSFGASAATRCSAASR